MAWRFSGFLRRKIDYRLSHCFLTMTTPVIRAALERLLNDLQCLILKSQGVSGLCLDGDLVTWPDLLKPGGCYSPWIRDAITAARDALAAADAGGGEALLAAAAAEGEDNAWERAKERAWDMYKIVGYQGEQALDDRGFDRAADLIRDEITLIRRVPAPADGEVVELAASLRRIAAQNPMGIAVQAIASSATLLEQLATAAPPAPLDGEVGELVAWLNNHAAHLRTMEGIGALPETELQERLDRAATLIQQQAAELAALRTGVMPVPVSERPWDREGWCDEEGRCWFLSSRFLTWSLESPPVALTRQIARLHSLPAHAIPLPGVEVQR